MSKIGKFYLVTWGVMMACTVLLLCAGCIIFNGEPVEIPPVVVPPVATTTTTSTTTTSTTTTTIPPTQETFWFRKHSAGKYYVQWPNWCDRSGWPVGKDATGIAEQRQSEDAGIRSGPCNGLIFGCLAGGTPRKIEWVPVSRQYTGLQNAMQDAGPKYAQAGWVKGATVHLEIRGIDGKLRDSRYQGEYVLP